MTATFGGFGAIVLDKSAAWQLAGGLTMNTIQTASAATLAITGGTFTATDGTGSGANAGSITVGNGATLALGGVFDDTGSVILADKGTGTALALLASTTLTGHGAITLGDFPDNRITSSSAVTLTNVDDTIWPGRSATPNSRSSTRGQASSMRAGLTASRSTPAWRQSRTPGSSSRLAPAA